MKRGDAYRINDKLFRFVKRVNGPNYGFLWMFRSNSGEEVQLPLATVDKLRRIHE